MNHQRAAENGEKEKLFLFTDGGIVFHSGHADIIINDNL